MIAPYTTEEVLDALERPIDALIVIDFETYYADDFTLSNMTNEGYVRDPRFECILVGVKVNASPAVWMTPEDFRAWAATVNWARVAVEAHHAHFDGLILSHHFGIVPGFWFDTLSMGRALHGTEVGNSLDKLTRHYGLGEKGHEVVQAKNKRRADFTPEEYAAYGSYCVNDCELEYKLLHVLLPQFPEIELWTVDSTVRWFTEPYLRLDEGLLRSFLAYEQERKAALMKQAKVDKKVLSSNEKFAALLSTVAASKGFDLEVPTKISPTTGEEIYAFAKSDPGMQELLDHPVDEIRWLAEARIAIKSTINETRTERLLRCGVNGKPVTVYLKYGGAHTHRWAGGDKLNFQNFERVPEDPKPGDEWKGTIRKALLAQPDARAA